MTSIQKWGFHIEKFLHLAFLRCVNLGLLKPRLKVWPNQSVKSLWKCLISYATKVMMTFNNWAAAQQTSSFQIAEIRDLSTWDVTKSWEVLWRPIILNLMVNREGSSTTEIIVQIDGRQFIKSHSKNAEENCPLYKQTGVMIKTVESVWNLL